jgi:hypothetical protein
MPREDDESIDGEGEIHLLDHPILKKFVRIPCIHRHPNIFCLLHGDNCPGDVVHKYPECPNLKAENKIAPLGRLSYSGSSK